MRNVQILAAVLLISLLGAAAVGQFYDGPFVPPAERRFFLGDGMPVRTRQFSGEVSVVPHKASDGRRQVAALLRPNVHRVGERQYLVGQDAMAGQTGGAAAGASVTLWIPLERTAELHEFESLDEARRVWNSHRRPERDTSEAAVEAVP